MAGSVTLIGRSARVRGRVTGTEDVEVRGFVDGEIAVGGDVTVDAEGLVGAGIHGRRLVIRGAVKGDLVGEESILLEDGARVVGDIRAPRVAIAPGALVRGFVETGGSHEGAPRAARSAQSAARPAASPPAARAAAAPVTSSKATPPKPPAATAPVPAPAPVAAPAATNNIAHEAGPRRPPPPVVPALKKAKGQMVKKKER
jgi:cytoskeletal protein CcmA (bactofilin family)